METYAIYLACKDPGVPWYAKLIAVSVVAYAFSPVDLIPDFIPVLGLLDDLIILPLGIALVIKLIPENVLAECRARAQVTMNQGRPKNWIAAVIIIVIWFVVTASIVIVVVRVFKG